MVTGASSSCLIESWAALTRESVAFLMALLAVFSLPMASELVSALTWNIEWLFLILI